MKIDSYYINKNGIKGLVKSAGIWGIDKNRQFPLVYLRKPKYLDEEKFQQIIDTITISLEKGFEVGIEPVKNDR
jgi:hypothetical protein